jgi:hypothetical protein
MHTNLFDLITRTSGPCFKLLFKKLARRLEFKGWMLNGGMSKINGDGCRQNVKKMTSDVEQIRDLG